MKTVFLLESSGPNKFCLQRRCPTVKESSASIIINEVRCADISFHSLSTPFVDNSVIIISRNMIAIPRRQCFFSLAIRSFLSKCVESSSDTETGKEIEKELKLHSIQFSFLRLSGEIALGIELCMQLYVEELLIFFICYHGERKNTQ